LPLRPVIGGALPMLLTLTRQPRASPLAYEFFE